MILEMCIIIIWVANLILALIIDKKDAYRIIMILAILTVVIAEITNII